MSDDHKVDPSRIPCPFCKVQYGQPCKKKAIGLFHTARKQLASEASASLETIPDARAANAGFDAGLIIGRGISEIVARGREGHHDQSDKSCGCGLCCSMLARGLLAAIEGAITASKESPIP
jgi:hypothetical protein